VATDKDKLFDDVVDAFHQSTGNLPDESMVAEIENLIVNYEEPEGDS